MRPLFMARTTVPWRSGVRGVSLNVVQTRSAKDRTHTKSMTNAISIPMHIVCITPRAKGVAVQPTTPCVDQYRLPRPLLPAGLSKTALSSPSASHLLPHRCIHTQATYPGCRSGANHQDIPEKLSEFVRHFGNRSPGLLGSASLVAHSSRTMPSHRVICARSSLQARTGREAAAHRRPGICQPLTTPFVAEAWPNVSPAAPWLTANVSAAVQWDPSPKLRNKGLRKGASPHRPPLPSQLGPSRARPCRTASRPFLHDRAEHSAAGRRQTAR